LALGLAVGLVSGRASSQPATAPTNINAEPSTPRSIQLTGRSGSAEAAGEPQAALKLADEAIAADARDPWGYYDKGAALSRLGMTDEALKAFAAAEERYAPSDQWGRSVTIYGRAHALDEARRCDEARKEFARYAAFVRERDPSSADLAMKYATECRSPTEAPHGARR
jgi:tetratricopeptide (TPR) repeat protein